MTSLLTTATTRSRRIAEPDRTGVKKRTNRKNAAKNDLTAGIFFKEYSFMVFRFMYYFLVKYFYTTRNSINTRNDKRNYQIESLKMRIKCLSIYSVFLSFLRKHESSSLKIMDSGLRIAGMTVSKLYFMNRHHFSLCFNLLEMAILLW